MLAFHQVPLIKLPLGNSLITFHHKGQMINFPDSTPGGVHLNISCKKSKSAKSFFGIFILCLPSKTFGVFFLPQVPFKVTNAVLDTQIEASK